MKLFAVPKSKVIYIFPKIVCPAVDVILISFISPFLSKINSYSSYLVKLLSFFLVVAVAVL